MEYYIIFIFFVFGSVFGSFFNVIGLRLPKGLGFATDRSYCPHCKKKLTWLELIPIMSYILQIGKCRGCKQPISILYPIIEFLTGWLFALSYLTFGWQPELVMGLTLSSLVAIIIVSDLNYMLIPNKVIGFFFPIFIIIRLFSPLTLWWSSIAGAIIGFVIIFLIIILSKGGMGAGDLKLFTILGIVLGFKGVLLTFFLATLFGALVSIILLLSGKVNRKTPVPFGPFICIAACITYFYGYDIMNWYVTSFF